MNLFGLAVMLVVFGATLAALNLVLFALTPALLAAIARKSARPRADSILAFRSLPFVAAVLVSVCIFLPSWWRYEPLDAQESVSVPLLALALLALLPVVQGLRRGARMFTRTRERLQLWRMRGRPTASVKAPFEVVEVGSADLALCVGGYLTPTIYASTEVRQSLLPAEFQAALAHEISHARTRDPLRLLWMGSCPDFLRLFHLDDAWRRAFTSACEFAADEGASRGDHEVALNLASALLKVARLRTFHPMGANDLLDVAVSSAFSSRADLEARISALAGPVPPTRDGSLSLRPWMLVAAVSGLLCIGILASEPIHTMTEAVAHVLAP